jgi:3-oxoadipate enol-lactonase
MIDVGAGPAIVMIPGIQGRWEWMRPAVDALAVRWRVVTGSMPGEPGESRCDTRGFDQLVTRVDEMLNEASLSSAVICGVSFGGLVALRYAATRPARVRALILVSTPGPRWRPAAQQARYLRRPMLTLPLFLSGAARRVWAELRETIPDPRARLSFCARWGVQVLATPGIPWRMASRARLAAAENFEQDCAHVAAPTLVIVGERDLDKVVRVDDTMEYVDAIRGARFRLFENTGHLGTVSAPDRFAAIVSAFLQGVPE